MLLSRELSTAACVRNVTGVSHAPIQGFRGVEETLSTINRDVRMAIIRGFRVVEVPASGVTGNRRTRFPHGNVVAPSTV